ncbi:MAG: hypothetical protein HYY18_00660 [Planctomycetes bacterium]|nr:hypothetical protein [Planctomycetota bacterium]
MNDSLRDALAARAAGEGLPGAADLDRALSESKEARAELAGLEAALAVLRAAVPAPSEERRRRVFQAAQGSGRRWIVRRSALAAAVLLTAGVAVFGGLRLLSRTSPVVRPGDRETLAGPRSSRLTLADVLADLRPEKPSGPPLGPGDVRPAGPSRLGGGGRGTAESAWLAPVARQAGLRGIRPAMLPGPLSLARAAVLRAAPGGPPADVLWQRYAGDAGEMILLQAPRESAAWLETVPLPPGWTRLVAECHGFAVLLASPSADEPALRKVHENLVLLPE